MSNRNLAVFVLIALFFTILGMATTSPALNTGDYVRTLSAMSLSVGEWTVPSVCIPYNSTIAAPPTSSLALFGVLFVQLDQVLDHPCMHHERWYIALSLIYWIGGFVALGRQTGGHRGVRLFLLTLVFFLFSGYFYSFYEETFLIALVPWLFAVLQARKPALLPFLIVLGLAMYVKTQVLFFAPIFLMWIILAHRRAPSVTRTGLAVAVMAIVGWQTLNANTFNVEQNAYNRIFNGIGWSLLGAEAWPAREFDARHTYFYEHEATLTKLAGHACAPEHLDIMGTAFWPTADDIWNMARATPTPDQDATFVQNLGFGDFFACFTGTVSPFRYLHTLYAIYLSSDYSVPYAINYDRGGAFADMANAIRALILRYLPYFSGMVALLVVALSRSRSVALAAGYILLVTPLLVVVADGFFEFEKHMNVNFVILLGPVLLGAPAFRRERMVALPKVRFPKMA